MHVVKVKAIVPLMLVVGLSLVSGCTDYKKKYDYLNVEHQNLKGRFENLQNEKQQLAQKISQDQQTIDELRRQIEELNQTPAQATGFGEGYDVAFDPAAGTITVTLPNTILFESGKAELKSATSAELDHILSVLKSKYSGKEIDVVGHTDTDPIAKTKDLWKDNWELSAERALSVARYLMAQGIPDGQVRASGCGPARPVAPNTTSAGKAKNRRVEIVVHMR
ncbi:MAG: OmpA family protein [Sedimentisphaerales bacterium]|jgi:chemotaxis protein MotB|nr:OmpA family protein [Sedimentisphaerales bacterium]NLZ05036.1 OmpA family protein [Phycisphaerae bacterium]HNY79152.1 OmpA family protein [Sedimentisphaerales bacterium]HOC64194.1 OmpA family protein [Sedimentisphaerales bacterium]HOH65060.1 OmpA family protein [Sedimentisphaerales bacterium]